MPLNHYNVVLMLTELHASKLLSCPQVMMLDLQTLHE